MLARRPVCWMLFLFSHVLVACAPAAATEPAADPAVDQVSEPALAEVAPPADTATPDESYPRLGVVWPTATRPPGPYPPQIWTPEPPTPPTVTPGPTWTPTPTRTPIPTPVVTPIPTAVPPIIPFPEGTTSEPFTLYYRDGDVIRSLSSTGDEEAAVFFDPAGESGLYLVPEEAYTRDWGAVSPDGQQIAVLLTEAPDMEAFQESERASGIYLLGRESRELCLLVENGFEPVWSPNGQWIAYRAADGSLTVIDVASAETRVVYTPASDSDHTHNVRSYAWAPDSRRLVLVDDLPMQMAALIVVDVENPNDVHNLTGFSPYYGIGEPQWSPSGETIAVSWYADEEENGPRLWLINAINGDRKMIDTEIDVDGSSPQWSPDSQWIVVSGFVRYESTISQRDIWMVHADGKQISRLTEDLEVATDGISLSELNPMWPPDSTEILYLKTTMDEDRREIWVLSLADGNQRQLTFIGRPFDIGLTVANQQESGGQ